MGTERTPTPDIIRAQLNRILASKPFRSSELQKQFLTFVVVQTLEGKSAEIKEYVVGTEAFSRGVDFDPRVDSVVRVVARRVRERLAEFYRQEGRTDSLVIEVPAGSYVPSFSVRQLPSAPARSSPSSPKSPPSPPSGDDLIGKTISNYEVLELLAKGGSGLVFRAEDLRLKRGVALKVLFPKSDSEGPQLPTLMREARYASAVNHPNICAIYDVGEYQARAYIVMELVEGKTLDRFIDHKPLETGKLLDIGIQISDALTAAHSLGIAHRDVRSANVVVNNRGHVKLLDFSSAYAFNRESPAAAGGYSNGLNEAERADIQGMGTILYEMITGQHLAEGANPSPCELNAEAPVDLDRLAQSAIEGDPGLKGVSQIRDELLLIKSAREQKSILVSDARSSLGAFLHYKWLLAGALAVVILGVLTIYFLLRPVPQPKILTFKQLTHDGEGKLHSFSFGVPTPLLSDNSRLYFQEVSGSKVLISQVSVSGGETVPLRGDMKEPLILMDLSPDRSDLLVRDFFGKYPDRSLLKMSLPGGALRPTGKITGHDAAWSPDGSRICYANGDQLYVANSNGTDSRQIASLPGPPAWPRWSPDGKRVRFTVRDSDGTTSLWEVAPASPNPHVLLPGWNSHPSECCGSWSPDGKDFVFQSARDGSTSLWGIHESHSLFGSSGSQPTRLTEGPLIVSAPLFSSDGHQIYAIVQQRRGELVRYDAEQHSFNLYLGGISADHVEFSRDSQWIAYSTFPEETIWRSRPDGSERLQLSSGSMAALFPRWSPDGQHIAFMASRPGAVVKIFLVQANGSEPEALLSDDSPEIDPNWSPDGNSIMFAKLPSVNEIGLGQPVIQIVDLKTRKVSTLPGSEGLTAPRWSPDGRFVVATALAGGKWGNPAVRIFDFTTGKWSGFESDPIDNKWWSADGKYFYFDKYMDNDPAIYRLRLSDRSIERVTSLNGVRRSFSDMGWWMGITPDGSPMVLRDTSIEEVYAMGFGTH
jgi:Tol biopolymer transport system component